MTQDEVLSKIRKIEREQEELDSFISAFKNEEEQEDHYMYHTNQSLDHRFEECQEDRELLNLLEEEQELLRNLESTRYDLVSDFIDIQKKTKYKCELEVDELRRELQRLEVLKT